MATFIGTVANEMFLFQNKKAGNTVYADGLAGPDTSVGSNLILAGRGDDALHGGYGRDMVMGGAGDDVIYGYGAAGVSPGAVDSFAARDGADLLDGGAGNDRIEGGGGDDLILGGRGNDVLHGGSGRDVIAGGSGNDVIAGGRGADILSGGAGRDIFRYAYDTLSEIGSDANEGRDTILDFRPGQDVVDLRGYAVTQEALQITLLDDRLRLSFDAVFETGEIDLMGVQALRAGDILFA